MDGYNDASMRNEGGCAKCPFRIDAVDHYECNNPDSIHYEESVNLKYSCGWQFNLVE